MNARVPWQRRELFEREAALETLIKQDSLKRVVLHRPERKRNRSALAWLRVELARVREDLRQDQQQGERS